MGGVFISYRRDDSRGSARAIYERLVDRFGREAVFFDVADGKAGYKWRELLSERVLSCDALIAVIGRGWNPIVGGQSRRRLDDENDQVRFEIETAFSRGIPVFPILVDGATVSAAAEDLPIALKQLPEWQSIEVSEAHFDYDIDRLNDALSSVLKRPSSRLHRYVIVLNQITKLLRSLVGSLLGLLVTATAMYVLILAMTGKYSEETWWKSLVVPFLAALHF
jgi:hypothetical protein